LSINYLKDEIYKLSIMLESLYCIFFCLVSLYMVDKFIINNNQDKHRWFLLHFFGNSFVTFTSFSGFIHCLKDPINSMNITMFPNSNDFLSPASLWPISMINSIHIYHILFYKLDSNDLFHHLLFIPTVGFLGQFYSWGPMGSFLAMFISGLPGGKDYLSLYLYKKNCINKLTQKKYSFLLNIFIRAPFICFNFFLHYLGYIYGVTDIPPLINFFVAGLGIFNAMYYLHSSTESYIKYRNNILK
jgi:hypothetical protein